MLRLGPTLRSGACGLHRPGALLRCGRGRGAIQINLSSANDLLKLSPLPLALVYWAAPDGVRALLDVPCLFTALLGLQCPGCGLKTAIVAIFDGDLSRAWAINPLAPVALALLVWVFIHGVRDLAPMRGK